MKKIIALILVIATLSLCAMSLASCGPDNVADFVVPENGYDGSEVTITFYHTMGADLRKVLEDAILDFNEIFPNITIVHEQTGSYDDVRDTIKTEIAVGAQPNIAYCYPDHVALYNLAKAVVPLDDLIASTITTSDGGILGLTQEQIDDFIPGYYEEGKQFDAEGTMYTIPLSKSTEVLYYNKTFFEANGLSVPTTWDELEALCKKIKEIDPASIPLGYDSESNWFITMCEQYGSDYTSATGEHFLFDNEQNRSFVKKFREWYKLGYITTQEILGSYTSELFKTADGTRSYMSIGSSAGATHQRPTKGSNGNYPFEVGIATIPQVNADNKKVISQGPSLCLFQSENPQETVAAWLFMKFLTTNVEFQAEFSMASGYVPVLKSVSTNPVYADFIAKADGGDYVSALSAKVCLEQESAYYTSPAFMGSSDARDAVGLLIQTCLVEPGDADAVIDKAFKEAITTCREGN